MCGLHCQQFLSLSENTRLISEEGSWASDTRDAITQPVRLMGYQMTSGPEFHFWGFTVHFPIFTFIPRKRKGETVCLLTATKDLWTPLSNIPGGHEVCFQSSAVLLV